VFLVLAGEAACGSERERIAWKQKDANTHTEERRLAFVMKKGPSGPLPRPRSSCMFGKKEVEEENEKRTEKAKDAPAGN
jgi:hypothetical protein